MDRFTLIVAQIFITFFMAFTMSGIMALIIEGPSRELLSHWPKQALTAWPIAFIFTQIYGPLSFFIAGKLRALRG